MTMAKAEHPEINVITLALDVEKILENSLHHTPNGIEIQLPPQIQQHFFDALETANTYCLKEGYKRTALLCDSRIRFHLRRLIEKRFPNLPVLSYTEVAPGFIINILTTVSLAPPHERTSL